MARHVRRRNRKAAAGEGQLLQANSAIFQANCQGCISRPREGDFVMTSHDKLLAAGESGKKAMFPGNRPKVISSNRSSRRVAKARMREGKKPLDQAISKLVKK